MKKMMAVAHRGYSARYPENTRLAYEAAIAAKAHVIECDARFTADGRVMACHDPNLKRLAQLDQPVGQVHSDRIRSLDLGRGDPPAFLDEVLEIAKGRVQVLIDMKSPSPELAQAVLEAVQRAGSASDVYTGTRELEQMIFMMERNPAVRHVGLVADYDQIPQWRAQGAYAVRAWEDALDHPQVAADLASGQPVWVTAGRLGQGEAPGFITRERLAVLEKAGAAAVLLNDPGLVTGRTVDL